MKNNLTLKKTTLRSRNKIVLGILSAALLTCNAVVEGSVDVSVLTGMSCPGVSGSGITTHRALSVGGLPGPGFATSPNDRFSVGLDTSQYKCLYGFGWTCNWNKLSYDETPWGPPPNSFISRTFGFTNVESLLLTISAGTYGKAWYWSANQNWEYWTGWNYSQDHC